MVDLEPYLDKFSESGKRVLESAFNEMHCREQNFISPEHILYALINAETDLFNVIMHDLLIDLDDVKLAIKKRLENNRQYTGKGFRIAPETTEVFKHSLDKARSENRRTIEASNLCSIFAAKKLHLLEDILQNPEGSGQLFRQSKIEMNEKQKLLFSELQNEASSFLLIFL